MQLCQEEEELKSDPLLILVLMAAERQVFVRKMF